MKKFRLIALLLVITMTVAVFAGCTPSAKSLKEKYEKADFEVTLDESPSDEDLEWSMVGMNNKLEMVIIACYKDSADAKKAYDEILEDDADACVVKKGNVVIFASNEATLKIA